MKLFAVIIALVTLVVVQECVAQDSIDWQGHTWKITNGTMAGLAHGSPANVSVDASGFLHLSLQKLDGKWTGAEVFSSENMGFGTYQWLIEGDVWHMDPVTVLGLFPYGPAHKIGADATNEIDIEFSQWNHTCHCNADFTIYPSIALPKHKPSYELNFRAAGGTNITTARMVWSPKSVEFTLMKGNQPIRMTASVIKRQVFKPARKTDIPQQPVPLGMNLWAFKALPSTDQSVIIRRFIYVPWRNAPGTK